MSRTDQGRDFPEDDSHEQALLRRIDELEEQVRQLKLQQGRTVFDALANGEHGWLVDERLRTLADHAPLGVAVHRDGRFVHVNRPLLRMLGYESSEELLGASVLRIVHPRFHDIVRSRIARIVTEGTLASNLEETLVRRDGTEVKAEVVAMRLSSGDRRSILVMFHDVTDRRRLEEQLLRAQRMDAVGRLAGGVAHDFNNLLFVVLNAAAFVQKQLPLGSSVLHDVEQIRAAAQRAANLTKQLLLFARGAEPVAEVLDVTAVVLGLRDLLERTLGEAIELKLSHPAGPCSAKLSRDRLEQVLVNLAVNARDAMPRGGVLHIETSTVDLDEGQANRRLGLSPGAYVRLIVGDNGLGMPSDVVSHAFEPFFTTKEPGAGTGLGLSITYGIVQQAGGHVALESAEGHGTRVIIHLPLTEADDARHDSGPPGPLERASRGEVILVVEDDRAVAQLIERLLTAAGYEVLAASGPGEALLLAEQHTGRLDLLLADVALPRMSGPALAQRLRALYPDLRVLLMSGYAHDARHDAGHLPLLSKPFDETTLLARVSKTLLV